MEIKHKDLVQLLKKGFHTKVPIDIKGKPGIGKSEIVEQTAKDLAIECGRRFVFWNRATDSEKEELLENGGDAFIFADLRLSQFDQTDLKGFPKADDKFAKWVPNLLFKVLSNNDVQGLVFFDELNLAAPSVVASCFEGNTLIPGEQYKEISELEVGDKVIDMHGNLQNVYEIKTRNYDGDMIAIKGRNFLPIKATTEHPFLTIAEYRKKNKKHNIKEKITKPIWKKAEELIKGDYIGIPILKPTIISKSLRINNQGYISKTIELNEDLAKFLGYYVGDGYSSKGKIGICLNKSEKAYQKEVIKLMTNVFGKEPSFRLSSENCVDIRICNTEIGKWLKEICGKDTYNKVIPRSILFHKNKTLLQEFLKGYFNADGHIFNNKEGKNFVGMTTVNKSLAMQLQQAGTRFGALFSIFTQPAGIKVIKGKKCNCREAYRIQSSQKEAFDLLGLKKKNPVKRITKHFFEFDDKLWARIDSISNVPFKGMVYNCEVENTHSYLAHNYIVHNCYQLINDHIVGECPISYGVYFVSAGNGIEDTNNAFDDPAPLNNRRMNVILEPPIVFNSDGTGGDWVSWAASNSVDSRIISFLHWKQSMLFKYDKDSKDASFPSPRMWFKASKLIIDVKKSEELQLLVGCCVGEAASREFVAFTKLTEVVNAEEIIKNPEKIKKHLNNLDILHNLVGQIADIYKKDNEKLNQILLVCQPQFLPPEFSMYMLRVIKSYAIAESKISFAEQIKAASNFKLIAMSFKKFLM